MSRALAFGVGTLIGAVCAQRLAQGLLRIALADDAYQVAEFWPTGGEEDLPSRWCGSDETHPAHDFCPGIPLPFRPE